MQPETPAANSVSTEPPKRGFKLKLPGAWKTLCLVLLLALVASVWMWKPWQTNIKVSDRTISVTGDATVKAEPDEFIFSPSYDITNSDQQKAIAELTAKNNDIIAKLKALGVADNKIESNASNYKDYFDPSTNTYTFNLTVTVDDKTLAQKVQDYLLTTTPNGNITPDYTFSDYKQKSLETQARTLAEKDARTRADQSAANLGFKIKAVKSVQDGSLQVGGCGLGIMCPNKLDANIQNGSSAAKSLTLQPGQNDVPYSVTVTYYIN
jgi:uncharacterized protein